MILFHFFKIILFARLYAKNERTERSFRVYSPLASNNGQLILIVLLNDKTSLLIENIGNDVFLFSELQETKNIHQSLNYSGKYATIYVSYIINEGHG